MFNPDDQREYKGMINATPVRRPGSEATDRAKARPAGRELVGRRGSALAEVSRSAADRLVYGKRAEPTHRCMTSTGAGAIDGVDVGTDYQRVLTTDLTPWRMICALRTRSPSGAVAVGTGWLAGPRTIITAGHLVHHRDFHGGWAGSIEVSAGRNGPECPFSQFTATKFAALDSWVADADPDFNIGCIQLDRPLGDLVGWFGLASPTATELEAARVNIGGYPADRGDGAEQYFQSNRILKIDDRRISFDFEIVGAQSGAPVWIHRTPSAPPVVVAVQAYCTGGTPFDPGIPADSAPRIIPETFDMMHTWIHEDISVPA